MPGFSRGAAVATLLVAACCLVGVALMQNHRGPVEDESMKSEARQYRKVAAKNAWLEQQDHQLKSQVRGAATRGRDAILSPQGAG